MLTVAHVQVELVEENFLRPENATRLQTWVVNFDRDWERTRWRDELKPLLDAMENLLPEASGPAGGSAQAD